MKIFHFIFAVLIAILLASCSKENFPSGEQEMNQSTNEDTSVKYLNLVASISQLVESRAVKLHEVFSVNEQMGVWTDSYVNQSSVYNGVSWNGSLEFTGANKEIYAYLPYNSNIKDKTDIPIDITSQEDYIYASGITTEKADADLKFKHALAQIRILVENMGYTKPGVINQITLINIVQNPSLDITTGLLTDMGEKADVQIGGGYNLSDNLISAGVFAPISTTTTLQVIVRIDDKDYFSELKPTSAWKAGYIYTYNLKIRDESSSGDDNHVLFYTDQDVDVDYWSSYGKDDRIMSVQMPVKGADTDFMVSPSYAHQGWDLYQGKACMFGFYFAPVWDDNKEGDIRLVYIDKYGAIKGQTSMQHFVGYKAADLFFFDYMTLAPGRYRILPVIRFKGETAWIMPAQSGFYNTVYTREHSFNDWPDEDWGYDVQAKNDDLLMCRDMWVDGLCYPGHYQMGMHIMVGEEYVINYILTNNSMNEIKGTLYIKDERGFSKPYNCNRPCDKSTDVREWSDIIYQKTITIPAGVRNWKDTAIVKSMRNSYVKVSNGHQHLYFQPEGTTQMYLLIKDWAPILNEHKTDPSSLTFWGANATGVVAVDDPALL